MRLYRDKLVITDVFVLQERRQCKCAYYTEWTKIKNVPHKLLYRLYILQADAPSLLTIPPHPFFFNNVVIQNLFFGITNI